jgi:glutamate racemase
LSPAPPPSCIGIFDSGVGGLSILQAVRTRLPEAPLRYVADSAFAPYGERDDAEILRRSERITDHLVAHGARLVVVACNTATAVAIDRLRAIHPQVAFVGVEPGVRPAVAASRCGHIGVMATTATLRSARFEALLAREAVACRVHLQACPGMASAIEHGHRHDPELLALIAHHAGFVRDAGVDVVALGCTHYPFVRAEIQRALGDGVRVIDTADAVAAQVARLWQAGQGPGPATCLLEATGDTGRLAEFAERWLGLEAGMTPASIAV